MRVGYIQSWPTKRQISRFMICAKCHLYVWETIPLVNARIGFKVMIAKLGKPPKTVHECPNGCHGHPEWEKKWLRLAEAADFGLGLYEPNRRTN